MDAAEMITTGKVCVLMTRGFGWQSASGVDFTKEKPFQMMDGLEATLLIKDNPERFRLASKDEVRQFYTKTSEVSSEKNADDIIKG